MKYFYTSIILFMLASCSKESEQDFSVPDWTPETHGNEALPDFEKVFGEGKVLRFDIKIEPADWQRMQSDLSANVKLGNPPPPIPVDWEPLWVPCSFFFEGREWYKVGIRYKGNSSLKECVRRNIRKYSLKLDFDEFEDEFPFIDDQRFYGFKQLNLANGFDDMSLMREKTAADLFRSFGIPSAHATFCEVWIDTGSGPKYFGLYTLIEEVDDTVIETQFTGGGNLYKPSGGAANFAQNTFNTRQMYLKTNTENANYADVRALYEAINHPSRLTGHQDWKTRLEGVFDVPHYLKWLAANTVIQNWDTYGKMSHNYYLYNNPGTGKLTWIPWDNNEALAPGKQGGALSLGLTEVDSKWPLIRYIIDDQDYRSAYLENLSSFTGLSFAVADFEGAVNRQADLIREYATAELQGYTFLSAPYAAAFENAVLALKQHAIKRNIDVSAFLSGQ
jgi:hypothetical protein